ncbi:MAG: efflux RND transporter permease subunit, partial [Spirochaetales bacterium]
GMVAPEVHAILLRVIADVYEGYADQTSLAFLNGEPAVMLSVQKQSGKNSLQTAQAIFNQIPSIESILPADIKIEVGSDTTEIIQTSINQVASSAIQGAFLAVLVLFLFLRSFKSTAIIAITIPTSLVITLGIMYFAGLTLNLMTLAGLALGVGMLVDNSVVILENIYSYRERGTKATVAAILGSQEMTSAIVSSTLTTICVFLPLVMFSSELEIIGQLFSGLTFTIVFSLLCSLAVAIIFVPVLASKYLKLERMAEMRRVGLFGKFDRALERFFTGLENLYARAVKRVLRRKALFIIMIILLFVGSLMLIPVIGFEFMPSEASNTVTLNLEMPKGTKIDVTEEVIRQMEILAAQELQGVQMMSVSVGSSGSMTSGGTSTNTATLQIELYPYAQRLDGYDNDTTAKAKLRKYFARFPGADFSFSDSSVMSMGSSGVDIIIKSDDLDLLQSTADQIAQLLSEKAGNYITEVTSDLEDGLPQINVSVDRNRLYAFGLNVYSVVNELRANINGQTAGLYSDNGTDIDIVVGLADDDLTKLSDIDQIFVNNNNGVRIPLSNFAAWEESTSPVAINRENQMRTVHVTASTVPGISVTEIQNAVEAIIQQNIPYDDRVTIEYGGDAVELMANLQIFGAIIIMSIILVFSVMASQFESFLDPFIIIFSIPLSVIGIVAVYLMTGAMLNTISAVGLLILVGVIVNNGIVLIDYMNLLRKRGYDIYEACVNAAQSRLRPILMTTLTTVLALVPMAFFPGEGSEMVQPIGQTVLGGLSFGTLMTLFLMPVLYYIFKTSREKRLERRAIRKEKRLKRHMERVAEEEVRRAAKKAKQ